MVTSKQIKRAITVCMQAGIVPILTGVVGLGKSTIVSDLAKDINTVTKCIKMTKLLSNMDMSNFNLSKEVAGRVKSCIAEWIPLAKDEKDDDPMIIIFLDEIDRCPPDVQNIVLNILLEHEIENEKISSKVNFVGARNGSSDLYTTELSKASINRMCILYLKPDFESYESWAMNNDVPSYGIAFQKFSFHDIETHDFEDVSFYSARSMDKCFKITQMIDRGEIGFDVDDITLPIYSGLVGVVKATEYVAFLKLYNKIPTPDEVLDNPSGVSVEYFDDNGNKDDSILYALMNNVIRFAVKDGDLDVIEKALQFINRLPVEFKKAGATMVVSKVESAITCPTHSKIVCG